MQVPRQPLIVGYKKGVRAWDADFDFGAELIPIRGAIYAMHADLARNGDRAGIAMAHVHHQEEIRAIITAEDGREVETYMMVPHVKVDFVASFEADLGQDPPREIQIRWARMLFVALRNRQFNIRSFTFDGYQSLDSMQILETQYGVKADRLSTDISEEPWRNLRDLISEERVHWPKRSVLFNELLGLSRLPNRKIDHLAGGSKDEADAMACAVMGAIAMGGQEDPDGAQVYIEPEFEYIPPALAEHLPVGFSDPTMMRPDLLAHSLPVRIDGMGRPLMYDGDEELSMDVPIDTHWG